jgi:hypothetical protein
MSRLKCSVISQLVNLRARAASIPFARNGNEDRPSVMSSRQLLLILHRCRELRVPDRNYWPQFLFGKDLDEINQCEAATLILHLEIHAATHEKKALGSELVGLP